MKKNLLIALSIVTTSSINAQSIPTASLSAYYPFNNNTLDYVGTRHGVSAGVAQYGTDRWGNANACYDVVDNTNYINLPADYWIYGDYSVSVWVKVKQTMSYPRIYEFANGYGINGAIAKLCHAGNGGPTLEYAINLSNESHYFSSNTLALNTWYHLAFVTSGTQMSIYINGTLIGTYAGNHAPENIYRTKNKIGGSNAPLNDATKAYIDDFRLYDRAITQEEVTQLYNEPNNFVGIKEMERTIHQIDLFPNPSNDKTTLTFSSVSEQTLDVEIVDNLGKLVYTMNYTANTGKNELNLDMKNIAPGFYFVRIKSESFAETIKLIKG